MESFGFGWFAFGWFVAHLLGWFSVRNDKPQEIAPSEFGSAIVYAWAVVGVMSWLIPVGGL